jgi:hypothetical protein
MHGGERTGLVFNPLAMTSVYPPDSCPVRAYRYAGHYDSGGLPYGLVDIGAEDQAYLDSVVTGKTVTVGKEEDEHGTDSQIHEAVDEGDGGDEAVDEAFVEVLETPVAEIPDEVLETPVAEIQLLAKSNLTHLLTIEESSERGECPKGQSCTQNSGCTCTSGYEKKAIHDEWRGCLLWMCSDTSRGHLEERLLAIKMWSRYSMEDAHSVSC